MGSPRLGSAGWSWAGCGDAELGWAGLSQPGKVELSWAGLGWVVPGWVGLDKAGLGSAEAGLKRVRLGPAGLTCAEAGLS